MYEVRELEGGLVFYVPDIPMSGKDWAIRARAYIDGREVSGSGEGRLRADDLKVLKLITGTKGLCTLQEIRESVWGPGDHEEKLKGAILRLRSIGLRKLKDDAKSVIRNVPRKGYIYIGRMRVDQSEALPEPPQRGSRGKAPEATPSPVVPSPPRIQEGESTAAPSSLKAGTSRVALAGLTLLFAAGVTGYAMHGWISSHWRSEPMWERQVIQGRQNDGRTVWGSAGPEGNNGVQWMDIAWIGSEGWLCGAIHVGGGGGDVGSGVLLHTNNHGASWSRIDQKIASGAGTFSWGRFQYQWQGVGPLWSIGAFRLEPGKPEIELWLAATTGIYRSRDGGETWQRSTPAPDDPNYPQPYAEFGNLFRIVSSDETFAVGWQGIAHLSGGTRAWELQVPSGSFMVSAISGYPNDSADWDMWAAGQSGEEDRYRMIYHLKRPAEWEKFKVSGIAIDSSKGGLRDILLTDDKTGFAVGPGGTVVKGSKSANGAWSWMGIAVAGVAGSDLNSIAYTDRTLWIVGGGGLVLRSQDLGATWRAQYLKDEFGKLPNLARVRSVGHSLWIVGDNVVYRYSD